MGRNTIGGTGRVCQECYAIEDSVQERWARLTDNDKTCNAILCDAVANKDGPREKVGGGGNTDAKMGEWGHMNGHGHE